MGGVGGSRYCCSAAAVAGCVHVVSARVSVLFTEFFHIFHVFFTILSF